jgi:hypothetical protein
MGIQGTTTAAAATIAEVQQDYHRQQISMDVSNSMDVGSNRYTSNYIASLALNIPGYFVFFVFQ